MHGEVQLARTRIMLHLNHLLQQLILVVEIHIKLHHLQLQRGKRLMAMSHKQRGKILMLVKKMMLLYLVRILIQMPRGEAMYIKSMTIL
jgi:hypothetical protein